MWVGFHDDPSFRWAEPASERRARVEGASQKNATMHR
jgi:hypothetical protein